VAEITWTTEAQRWLEEIFEFIALEDPERASRVTLGIYEHAQVLKEFPHMGYRYQPSARHVRILLYGHYRIAYLVKDDRDVDILGVFHGSLDIARYQL
jgi:plasmid stabilization system protein ParE